MLAKLAALVAASILPQSKSYILRPSEGHVHDVSTRSSTATEQRNSAFGGGKLASQCECKSQSDAGNTIFGATLSDGSFGWCEYAPGVALECPHCCPDPSAAALCECKSQSDNDGDVIFGAATSDGSFGWCKYAPRIASTCPHCCPPASQSQTPTSESLESCANSALSSLPDPAVSFPKEEAKHLQDDLDDDANDLAQAFEDEGLSDTPLAHVLLHKRAHVGSLAVPTKELSDHGTQKVGVKGALTSRQRVIISVLRKFIQSVRWFSQWMHF